MAKRGRVLRVRVADLRRLHVGRCRVL